MLQPADRCLLTMSIPQSFTSILYDIKKIKIIFQTIWMKNKEVSRIAHSKLNKSFEHSPTSSCTIGKSTGIAECYSLISVGAHETLILHAKRSDSQLNRTASTKLQSFHAYLKMFSQSCWKQEEPESDITAKSFFVWDLLSYLLFSDPLPTWK